MLKDFLGIKDINGLNLNLKIKTFYFKNKQGINQTQKVSRACCVPTEDRIVLFSSGNMIRQSYHLGNSVLRRKQSTNPKGSRAENKSIHGRKANAVAT